MKKLSLSLACGQYDRTRPILDGIVGIEGCELVAHALPPEETFFRAFRNKEFDVAELSFSTYLIMTSKGVCPYVAIPAFVSRSFRHNSIYVRKGSGIEQPEDLKGKRVGVPEYQVTAAVWVRAMLAQDHGVDPSDVYWITGGVEEPGRFEKAELSLRPEIRIDPVGPGKTLGNMLVEGEIDALVCPRAPSCYRNGLGVVERLFRNPVAAAEDYYARHKVFPIMHVVGVRRSLVSEHPWLAGSVYKAFVKARDVAMRALEDTTALGVTLPWLVEEVERTRKVMGYDYWPYGMEDNRPTIDTFLEQHQRQGLSASRMQLEEVFQSSTMDQYKI